MSIEELMEKYKATPIEDRRNKIELDSDDDCKSMLYIFLNKFFK